TIVGPVEQLNAQDQRITSLLEEELDLALHQSPFPGIRLGSSTRRSPEMRSGSSTSRKAARACDSRRQASDRARSDSATFSKRRSSASGGRTICSARTAPTWARWWLFDVPVTKPSSSWRNSEDRARQYT